MLFVGNARRGYGEGNSFVLASYLHAAPAVVEDKDVQPLTQQLAELLNDPLHDPLFHGPHGSTPPGNVVSWMRPSSAQGGDQGRCGGDQIAHAVFHAAAYGYESEE